jgi:16S rRNA (guanine527-N7)-methyltransferase
VGTSRDPGIGRQVTAPEIEAAIVAAGLQPLQPPSGEQLAVYLQMLIRWNSKLNLTAIREPFGILRRHFIECIQCAQALPDDVKTLLDFGSGAGLPGVPIAIVRPEIHVTLGESQGKKAAFLREVVRVIGLNAQVFDRRIERMSDRQIFDAVTLRAVDRMAEASKIGWQRVRPGGWLIIFATSGVEESLKASLPDVTWERRLAISGLEKGILMFGRK